MSESGRALLRKSSQAPAVSVESHAHRHAKRLLLQWLRETAATAGRDEYADFCGLSWRVNRGGPHWGVWDEYPILDDDCPGLGPVWDEVCDDDRSYADDEFPPDEAYPWRLSPPTFDELIGRGTPPIYIVDIAIQHKGNIAFAVEVVHKHRCDTAKIAFLRDRLTLLEIPAHWVLGQVDRPREIPPEFYL